VDTRRIAPSGGPSSFGVLLHGHRVAAGLSQAELAERAGLSARAISDLERGARRFPYPTTVRRLARALGLGRSERAALIAARATAGVSACAADKLRPEVPTRPAADGRDRIVDIAGRPARRSNNLPAQLSSFVGREREVADVRCLLQTTRLLTLTGTGGVGKTRLALQVASETLEEYPDGIWFIDLAPLGAGELVARAVSSVLGVREEPTRPLVETLTDVLGARRLLLLLDNCEHLVQACAALADCLLRACEGLSILATSRETLRIDGETAWRAPSMTVPDELLGSLEQVRQVEAVRLFLERAVAAQARFRLTAENAAAVIEICQRLDGIPLAIELAAARVSMLPVEQLVARLDDRLRLLTGGSRLAPSRQQTLRATVQWSYDLLSEPERRLFNRLSVFAGGFGLDAAEALRPEEPIGASPVLELLGRLVDKSLVQADEDSGHARFRLLETLRQYAREQLQAVGDEGPTHDRHADFFVRLAEEAEPELWGPRLTDWLARLEREHDNLRAALTWCLARGDAERGLRLGGALARFWLSRGHLTEGREWLDRLLMLPENVAHGFGRATAINGAALLADYQGDGVAALTFAEEAVARARALGAARPLAMALPPLASSLYRYGDFSRASIACEEGIAASRAAKDRALEALNMVLLGRTQHVQGRIAAARELYETALPVAQDTGYARMQIRAQFYLGLLNHEEGDFSAARIHLQESLARSRDVADKLEVVRVLVELARLEADERDAASARQHLADAVHLGRELGHREILAECVGALARLLTVQGQTQQALHLVGAAVGWYEAGPVPAPPDVKADLSSGLAAAQTTLGEAEVQAALSIGRTLTINQAIAIGLEQN
jgi:predicted ATPase/transcriptional regulator with XRE-family HTH domain